MKDIIRHFVWHNLYDPTFNTYNVQFAIIFKRFTPTTTSNKSNFISLNIIIAQNLSSLTKS